MIYYHISPVPDLHKVGLKPGMPSRINYKGRRSPFVYLGTLDYIGTNYARYAPPGDYFLYRVDCTGIELDTNLPKGQVRYQGNIDANRVNFVKRTAIIK